MKEKKGNILFFGTIAVILFIVLGALLSPQARKERESSGEIKKSLEEEGFIEVSDEDTWFTWTCDRSYISQNGEVISVATVIGDRMIGKCDSKRNAYYKVCPEGVILNDYGKDDVCK